ncbi:hypothetical protein SY83_20910 [Paenibacillus swuensis]|uniref:Uncharacterized protein n=1 Tax=Paenibacillus swuensis TaxID=1178515 RepID=A0A172TNK8_9BACL|nr:hypothetical protein [Paenibacillus swuensis]ANE48333.1 hypothetical protein SY83_20910 [Paenibacillus swuensis]
MLNVGLVILKVVFSSLEFFSGLILSLTLFRFPVKNNYWKIGLMGAILGLLGFYLREIANLPDYAVFSNAIFTIVLITIFFRLNFVYSLLIAIIGIVAATLIEIVIVFTGVYLKLTTVELISTNNIHSAILFLLSGLVMLFISFVLQKRKIGFLFKSSTFTWNKAIKGYNFIVSAVLLVSILVVNFITYSIRINNVHFSLLIILALSLLIGLYVSYKRNKQLLTKSFERQNINEHY